MKHSTAFFDYIEISHSRKFTSGDTVGDTKCVPFSILDDSRVENTDTFLVELSSNDRVIVSGEASIVNIADDDGREMANSIIMYVSMYICKKQLYFLGNMWHQHHMYIPDYSPFLNYFAHTYIMWLSPIRAYTHQKNNAARTIYMALETL